MVKLGEKWLWQVTVRFQKSYHLLQICIHQDWSFEIPKLKTKEASTSINTTTYVCQCFSSPWLEAPRLVLVPAHTTQRTGAPAVRAARRAEERARARGRRRDSAPASGSYTSTLPNPKSIQDHQRILFQIKYSLHDTTAHPHKRGKLGIYHLVVQ